MSLHKNGRPLLLAMFFFLSPLVAANVQLEAIASDSAAVKKITDLLQRQKFAEALSAVETIGQKNGLSESDYLKLKAEADIGLNRKKEARDCIILGIKRSPQDAMFYCLKARVQDDTRNPKLCLADLNHALQINPNLAEAYMGRARVYFILSENFFEGDYLKQARADLNKAIALDPSLADAYDCLGVSQMAEHAYDKAVKSFSKAIAINKYKALYFLHRADSYGAMNELEKGLADLDQNIALDPLSRKALAARAATLERLGRYPDALKAYSRAAEVEPKGYETLVKKAALLVKMREYKLAIEEYDRLNKKSPLDDEIYVNRGKAWQAMGNYKKALEDFNEAIDLSPQLAAHYETRAALYGKMNEPGMAKRDKDKAAALRSTKI